MPLTRSFKERVQRHVAEDPAYAEALLREGVATMLAGDVDTGKAILRDYIKATVGFEKLGEATGAPPKSLIRMFNPARQPAGQLTPLDSVGFYYFWLGDCHFLLGNVDWAIDFLKKSRAANPQSPGTHLTLAAALGFRGDIDEARAVLADHSKLKPDLTSLATVHAANHNFIASPEFIALREKTIDVGLRRAGMPEK